MQERRPLPPSMRRGQHRDAKHNQKPTRKFDHSCKPSDEAAAPRASKLAHGRLPLFW